MRILITGICGFVGSTLAKAFRQGSEHTIIGIDNLSRPGSWVNRQTLKQLGIQIIHGDIRTASDINNLPTTDWVIDAAANPSVLSGVDGQTNSLQLVQHNLLGTINLLEYCKHYQAGLILLSSSRVYSIRPLSQLQFRQKDGAFQPVEQIWPEGISAQGIAETYTTTPPISLYGSTKLASEQLALEYGHTFEFPVWINRCGVMAGAGQFGHPGQGIFAFWLHSYQEKRPLTYIGFGGDGYQVRDCLHPQDLLPLLEKQFVETNHSQKPRVINLSGGLANSMSLKQLTNWCDQRFGQHTVCKSKLERPFDLPWIVLDSSLAFQSWQWEPQTSINQILEEIAIFAETNPGWCELSQTD